MEVDPPSPTARASSHSAPTERNVLLQENQLKLRGGTEKDIYNKLKTRRFVLTPAYDPALLQATCMNTKFELIFKTVGWEDVWEINKPGSKLLTAEFFCTLKATDSKVSFRLFGKDFSIPWKQFSELLVFHAQCVIDVDTAIQDFDRMKFWREISTELTCYHPRINEIHTLLCDSCING